MFHCLAYESANLLIGSTKRRRSELAWRQVYRSLEHGLCKTKCKKIKDSIEKFPGNIIDFANGFVTMQEKRHAADYNPHFRVTKSEVRAFIATTKAVIDGFEKCAAKDKRAFCAYVLLKDRN